VLNQPVRINDKGGGGGGREKRLFGRKRGQDWKNPKLSRKTLSGRAIRSKKKNHRKHKISMKSSVVRGRRNATYGESLIDAVPKEKKEAHIVLEKRKKVHKRPWAQNTYPRKRKACRG